MDNKLTLKLDNQVIEKAKTYARKKNTSLSKLIESYLQFLTSNNKNEEEETTPLVKSLSGILNTTKSLNYKESYKKHLGKKYSK
jgi:hemerythrin superfamily protein